MFSDTKVSSNAEYILKILDIPKSYKYGSTPMFEHIFYFCPSVDMIIGNLV